MAESVNNDGRSGNPIPDESQQYVTKLLIVAIVIVVMEMANGASREGIEHTSLAFWTIVLKPTPPRHPSVITYQDLPWLRGQCSLLQYLT